MPCHDVCRLALLKSFRRLHYPLFAPKNTVNSTCPKRLHSTQKKPYDHGGRSSNFKKKGKVLASRDGNRKEGEKKPFNTRPSKHDGRRSGGVKYSDKDSPRKLVGRQERREPSRDKERARYDVSSNSKDGKDSRPDLPGLDPWHLIFPPEPKNTRQRREPSKDKERNRHDISSPSKDSSPDLPKFHPRQFIPPPEPKNRWQGRGSQAWRYRPTTPSTTTPPEEQKSDGLATPLTDSEKALYAAHYMDRGDGLLFKTRPVRDLPERNPRREPIDPSEQRAQLSKQLEKLGRASRDARDRESDRAQGERKVERKTPFNVRSSYESICARRIASIAVGALYSPPVDIKWSPADVICSYNLDREGNLFVPGSPPRYKTRKCPVAVTQTPIAIQPSSETLSTHLRYALDAINTTQPAFDFPSIDVICSIGALTTLYKVAATPSEFPPPKPGFDFAFRLYVVRNTLVIGMVDDPDIKPKASMYNFAQKFTTPEEGIPADSTHYRWIQIQATNLRVAVLTSADAWMLEKKNFSRTMTEAPPPDNAAPVFSSAASIHSIGTVLDQSSMISLWCSPHPVDTSKKALDFILSRVAQNIEGTWLNHQQQGEMQTEIVKLKTVSFERHLKNGKAKENMRTVMSLLRWMRYKMKETQHRAAVGLLRVDKRKKIEMQVWEPEFDEDATRWRGVPDRRRMARELLPTPVVERFWGVEEGGEEEGGEEEGDY